MGIRWRLALIPYFERRSVVDFTVFLLNGKEGFGGFEADRLRDLILCTQRSWRLRDRDFIYAKNSAPPGSDPIYLHKLLWGLFLLLI